MINPGASVVGNIVHNDNIVSLYNYVHTVEPADILSYAFNAYLI